MNEKKLFLLGVTAILGAIAFLMFRPFAGYIIGAAMIAFILKPLQNRVSKVLPRQLSAILLVILGISLFIIPFAYSALAVFEDARDLDASFDEARFIDLGEIEQVIFDLSGQEVNLSENIQRAVENFASATLGNFSELLGLLADLTVGLSIMLFLMYYLLLEGEKLVDWIKDITPLPDDIQNELYDQMEITTWAVIKGHVLVAIVQGLLAGLGLFLTGVPNYAFWTFVMVILAFIPVIGTFMVWGPASVYLVLTGESFMGAILMIYGFTVVSLSDNFLRPFAVDRSANLHPATILIGVIGGVYLFGAAGLFIGPIILGILKSVLLVFKNSYEDL